MPSKKTRAPSGPGQEKDAPTNDSSPGTGLEDGLLFAIAPEPAEHVSDSASDTRAPLDSEKPAPEELLLPSHDEVKALCSLAIQIKTLAPWQWLDETDVFGVEDPDTGEIGFISVMGNIGEYEAISVYSGSAGLYGFIDLQTDPSPGHDRLLETPQVQVSFTEPKFLEKRDRELLRSAGIKFTGTKPLFRSYRPGFLPWFITLKEARLLINALSQTLEMTKRFAAGSVIFPDDRDSGDSNGDAETEALLVRVSRQEKIELSDHPPAFSIVWEDQIKRIPRPKVPGFEISLDADLLADLKTIPLSAIQLEADLFIGPGRIGKPQERPLALYMLMLADRLSGIIFGFEALSAESSLNEMYASVPEKIARLLWATKVLPKQIIVRSVFLVELLEPLETELKIQLRCANKLPSLDKAIRSMTKWLETGKM